MNEEVQKLIQRKRLVKRSGIMRGFKREDKCTGQHKVRVDEAYAWFDNTKGETDLHRLMGQRDSMERMCRRIG